MAERPVQRQRLGRGTHIESLRDDDLDAVALHDQLAGLADPRAVLVRRSVRGDGSHDAFGLVRQRDRRVERGEHARDTARGVLTLAFDLVRDDEKRVPHVVETDHGVVDRERGLREPQDVARCGGKAFEAARRFVPDVSDGSA